MKLTQGQYALIDVDEYHIVENYRWYAVKGGNTFYARTYLKKVKGIQKKIFMHRIIMDAKLNQIIDHRNHIGTDNRRSNIRFVTRQQNNQNRKPNTNSTNQFKGVLKSCNEWEARIRIDGKNQYLGMFATQEEAAKGYDKAAKKHHGEFSHLNFP